MQKHKSAAIRRDITAYMFLLPCFTVYILFVCVPVLQSLLNSFTDWQGLGDKKFIGLANYIEIFGKDERYWAAFKNNIIWALGGATIPVWIGLLLANLLVKSRLKFSKLFQVIFFSPQIISMVAAAVIWKWIYDPILGPLNKFFEVLGMENLASVGWLGDPRIVMISLYIIYVWKSFGFSTVVFIAAIQDVDPQLYDAAKIDGSNWWGQFWNVTMPGIRQAMTSTMLLMVIWSFNIYDLIATTTRGGPGFSSMVISYYIYHEGFVVNRMGYATAAAVTMGAIILLFSMLFMRVREKDEVQ